jgi:spore coat polysaccharide biosynthesis protein SpsF
MVIAITQARISSTRLPGKVLKLVNNRTFLDIHIQRILQASKIDCLIIATTFEEGVQQIIDIATSNKIKYHQGSVNNVLERFYEPAAKYKPSYIVRLTSDCPLIDATIIDSIIEYTIESNVDYCSNTLNPQFPDGQDVEVFKFSALERAYHEATLQSDKEHVTPYIWRNSSYKNGNLFSSKNFDNQHGHYGNIRMTLDEEQDYILLKSLIEQYGTEESWLFYAEIINKKSVERNIQRNEGYETSLNRD